MTRAFLTPVPPVRDEFRCGGCGYGAFLTTTARLCPMCGAQHWLSRVPASLVEESSRREPERRRSSA